MTIVLAVLPMPVASTLPGLLLACAVLQGAAMALAFRGLWYQRASYAPSRTAADPMATGPRQLPGPTPRTA
ncbi:hypothetical protein AB0465_13920 [Streptomyces griseoviridis]|uniref:hypothetical protein n=1 Tax=Streptomyces griseoviridis TaxID=45398 RepID=UPI00340B51AE